MIHHSSNIAQWAKQWFRKMATLACLALAGLFHAAILLSFQVAHPAIAQEKFTRCDPDPAQDKADEHPVLHEQKEVAPPQKCEIDRVANDKERRRMERYVAAYIRKQDVVDTIELSSGEVIDCVDVYKQPALRSPGMKGHKVEFRPRSEVRKTKHEDISTSPIDVNPGSAGSDRKVITLTQEYAQGPVCPERSVPIRRLTMDTLKNFRTLDDFFSKSAPHLVDGPNNEHQYAHAARTVNNWGAQSILNVWSPYTEQASEFSLSQIWVVRGSGDDRETVEVGWQKYRDLYGDYRPRLFIYFTPDNYGNGGCYNLTCGAFVQVNNSVYIGGGFTNISEHPHPSTAWEFRIRWQKDGTSGHWWLKYGDTWVGYYPRSRFDSNGLRNRADRVDFGGEIIDDQPGGRHTRTDMGSGHFPGDGFGYAAYQRQIRYIDTSNVWGTWPSLTASRTDSDCYDIAVSSSSGDWERYFYFGGPGYNSHCQ